MGRIILFQAGYINRRFDAKQFFRHSGSRGAVQTGRRELSYNSIIHAKNRFFGSLRRENGSTEKHPLYKRSFRFEEPLTKKPDEKRTKAEKIECDGGLDEVEEKVYIANASKVIRKALSTIPENYSAAVYMYYLEGKTQKEIADSLGVSVSRAGQLVNWGIRKLRKCDSIEDLSELFYESRNLYKGTGVQSFRRHGSVQEQTIINRELLENRIRCGTRSEKIKYMVDILGLSEEAAERIADRKAGA